MRYVGNEIHSIVTPFSKEDINFLFAFPDLYEVGMSHLGLHIIYFLLNSLEGVRCERVFHVAEDLEEFIRSGETEFRSLESKTPLKEFDFIGFTLQYEMSYTTILNMLDLAGLSLRSVDRSEDDPIVLAGGPCSVNPEVLAPFIDLFYLGDGESQLPELMELKKKYPKREDFLRAAINLEGIYVPSFYRERYEDGVLVCHEKLLDGAPMPVKRNILQDLDASFYPEQMIIPFMDTVHDRAVMEIFRGCTQGCRFCQAGMIYRPVRERRRETNIKHIRNMVRNGGHNEFSLSSLSTLDYSDIEALVEELQQEYAKDHVNISLPSLRMDSFSLDVLEKVATVRKSSLTFAPEAGSQKLRDVINKNVSEEDIFTTFDRVFEIGYQKFKLYFIMGLPTETDEDILAISELAKRLKWRYSQVQSLPLTLTISTSVLVPKPFTPFQWMKVLDKDTIHHRQQLLKRQLNSKGLQYRYHDASTTHVEAVLARGDRRVADVVEKAFLMGSKRDSWSQHFSLERWEEAFLSCGLSMESYLEEIPLNRYLPWMIIDVGVTQQYLKHEYKKALQGEKTPDCREGCLYCGIQNTRAGGHCFDGAITTSKVQLP